MAQSRLDLHEKLTNLAGPTRVYFQPPENIQMVYPCIVYRRDSAQTNHADNGPYKHKRRYELTVIDQNPDSPIVAEVEKLPLCSYERFFTADNLNHDVFNLYF